MSPKKLPTRNNVEFRTAIAVAVIGLVGVAMTAYFGYLSNIRPVELSLGATQTANASARVSQTTNASLTAAVSTGVAQTTTVPLTANASTSVPQATSASATQYNTPTPLPPPGVTFLPLSDKDQLVKSFKLYGSNRRVKLRFIANNFELDFEFSAPLEMECRTLVYILNQHFALDEHIVINTYLFTGSSDSSSRKWEPLINGTTVDYCTENTLHDLALADGDLISLIVQLEFTWLGI